MWLHSVNNNYFLSRILFLHGMRALIATVELGKRAEKSQPWEEERTSLQELQLEWLLLQRICWRKRTVGEANESCTQESCEVGLRTMPWIYCQSWRRCFKPDLQSEEEIAIDWYIKIRRKRALSWNTYQMYVNRKYLPHCRFNQTWRNFQLTNLEDKYKNHS